MESLGMRDPFCAALLLGVMSIRGARAPRNRLGLRMLINSPGCRNGKDLVVQRTNCQDLWNFSAKLLRPPCSPP
jgi:hypothetical protein